MVMNWRINRLVNEMSYSFAKKSQMKASTVYENHSHRNKKIYQPERNWTKWIFLRSD